FFGAGELQALAQQVQQTDPCRNFERVRLPVDTQRNGVLRRRGRGIGRGNEGIVVHEKAPEKTKKRGLGGASPRPPQHESKRQGTFVRHRRNRVGQRRGVALPP